MTLYSLEVQKIFKGMKPPKGFIVDCVEYPDYLALRVYKDNIESSSESAKLQFAEYLYQLRDTIRTLVKCHIEGVTDEPPARAGKG